MTNTPNLSPTDLDARLQAAGVIDQASFEAALARDPELRAAVEAQQVLLMSLIREFVAVEDPDQMEAFWRVVPAEIEDPIIQAVARLIDQARAGGDIQTAENLAAKLADFQQICEEAQAEQQPSGSPVVDALIEFVNAPDESTARAVYEANTGLLMPLEAREILDENIEGATDAEFRQHLAERAALLRELRGEVA